MSECRNYQSKFPEALYGELGRTDQAEVEKHLEVCRYCREEYARFKETGEFMSLKKNADPGPDFWDNYWNKLDRRMKDSGSYPAKEIQENVLDLSGLYRKWTYRVISAAAMLLAGVGVGYLLFTQSPRPVAEKDSPGIPAEKVALSRETASYLESSKLLLLGFVNFDTEHVDPAGMDFSKHQEVAQSLIRRTAVLKDELKGKENQRVLELIKELEIILLQISNYEKNFNIPAIDLIKSGVDNSAIMMKINIEELIRSAENEDKVSFEHNGKTDL